jgi:bifunctional DNA-binding transcriptional regulator/antitoxin component of YhaV-PrlF toxin-antitoxin module
MNAEDAIAHALEDLLTGREMFTFYDVTKHARSFTNENVKYENVRTHVRYEMLSEDDYDCVNTQIEDVSGNYVYAVLYLTDDKNVNDYDQDAIQTDKSLTKVSAPVSSGCCGGNPCAAPAPVVTVGPVSIVDKALAAAKKANLIVKKFQGNKTPAIAKPVVSKDTIRCKVDTYGRIMIPKKFIDRIGLSAGAEVHSHVTSVKGLLVLAPIRWADKSATHLNTYIVDCYGNVKISKRILSKSNTPINTDSSGDYVNVRSEDNRIVIGE